MGFIREQNMFRGKGKDFNFVPFFSGKQMVLRSSDFLNIHSFLVTQKETLKNIEGVREVVSVT